MTALALARRAPRPVVAGLMALVPFAATGLALGLGEGVFGFLRLLAWGVFLHGPSFCVAAAWLVRRGHRRLAWAAAATAAALLAIAADAFLVEPYWLEVSHHAIPTPKLERPLRVVVIADLQTDGVGTHEVSVLARARALEPDLVLFAGDYIHHHDAGRGRLEAERLRRALADSALAAPLGMFAVRGNVDPGDWTEIFRGLPVTVIESTARRELPGLTLTGLGLEDSFATTARVAGSERFHIVFGHAPNFARGQVDADLLVAGHTHGGQVRLPGIGPLITLSEVPRGWAAGRTEIAPGRTLVVSRGVGMERGYAPRLRFLCRPELVVIDLGPG